jgi:hypothetical protein
MMAEDDVLLAERLRAGADVRQQIVQLAKENDRLKRLVDSIAAAAGCAAVYDPSLLPSRVAHLRAPQAELCPADRHAEEAVSKNAPKIDMEVVIDEWTVVDKHGNEVEDGRAWSLERAQWIVRECDDVEWENAPHRVMRVCLREVDSHQSVPSDHSVPVVPVVTEAMVEAADALRALREGEG